MKKQNIDEICAGIYRIKIPLPGNPLGNVNTYLIKSSVCNLLVDTGFNHTQCYNELIQSFRQLGVNLSDIDLLITHIHADHSGLLGELQNSVRNVYFSHEDARKVNNLNHWKSMVNTAIRHGFPREIEKEFTRHPGYKYATKNAVKINGIENGQQMKYGRYNFICISTPGHTSGHVCLYEKSEKMMFSGDHLLSRITPNVQCWSDLDNPLFDYFISLDNTMNLSIKIVLPGHGRVFKGHKKRILEIKAHHIKRLKSIIKILIKGPNSAYNIASEIKWNITYSSWESMSMVQKWFAMGEALAHLRYLESKNIVGRNQIADQNIFILNETVMPTLTL